MSREARLTEAAAAILPALREVRRRAAPDRLEYSVPVRSADGIRLDCRLYAQDPACVIVIAHPAVVGSRYHQVVELAEELLGSFSVMLFDFRGHGKSEGRCALGFTGPASDLGAVLIRARGLGFKKVGIAGFSLGAAAAFVAASRGARIDALASIGCPPSFPDVALWREHPVVAKAALCALGMRVDPKPDTGPVPLDVAGGLGAFPKLLLFGEYEVCPTLEIEKFRRRVSGPVEAVTITGAWHADLHGREPKVREWFERTLWGRSLPPPGDSAIIG